MYFVHASDRCTRKLSPLSTLLTSEQALLCRSPLSRAPLSSLPRRSAASRPYGARRWDPHRRLQRRARDPIKKKPLCVLCSLKCKAYFIPYEPNSLQWLDALVVCCRWKTEVQRLGCVCFGIWLWSRCSSGRGPDGGGARLGSAPSLVLVNSQWSVPRFALKQFQVRFFLCLNVQKKWQIRPLKCLLSKSEALNKQFLADFENQNIMDLQWNLVEYHSKAFKRWV